MILNKMLIIKTMSKAFPPVVVVPKIIDFIFLIMNIKLPYSVKL